VTEENHDKSRAKFADVAAEILNEHLPNVSLKAPLLLATYTHDTGVRMIIYILLITCKGKKSKVVPVKTYGGNGCIDPSFLDLGTSWS
jgi:hypothetical protein